MKTTMPLETDAKKQEPDPRKPRAQYQPPRIEMRRALSKATLFSYGYPPG